VTILWCALWLVACGGGGATPASASSADEPRCPEPPPPRVAERAPRLLVQDGHAQVVNWMALSGDGRLLATASIDGTMGLWDTRNGMLLRRRLAPGAANGVALDRAGEVLAFAVAHEGRKPHAIRVERVADERGVSLPKGLFALQPDGRTIAVANDNLTLFDTRSGKPRWVVPLSATKASAVGQDLTGERIAVAVPGEVTLVNAADGKVLRRLPIDGESDFERSVFDVALVGDRLLLKGSDGVYRWVDADGSATRLSANMSAMVTERGVWLGGHKGLRSVDPQGGVPRQSIAVGEHLFRTAASFDGRTLALAYLDPIGGPAVKLVDVDSGRVMRTLRGTDRRVFALAVAPDGGQLAVGSQAELSLWQLPSGERTFGSSEGRLLASRALLYGPQGRQLVSHEVPFLRVRDPRSGRVLRAWRPDSPVGLAFRPGTRELLTVSQFGAVERWDLSSIPEPSDDPPAGRRGLRPPPRKRLTRLPYMVEGAKLSPDGRHWLVLHFGGAKRPFGLVDATTFEERWTIESDNLFQRHFAFGPDGQRLYLSTYRARDHELQEPLQPVLQLFDVASGKRLREVELDAAGPMAFRDGTLLMGGLDPTLFDAATLKLKRRIELRDQAQLNVLAHPTLDAFFLGGDGGATAMVSGRGDVQGLLVATPGGDYVATTPDGAYRASLDGARRLSWSFEDPMEAFAFEQFAARNERADLVAARLALKPGERLAPVSRPPRVEIEGGRGARKSATTSTPLRLRASSSRRVDSVRVFVNGRLVRDEALCKPEGRLELDVPLQPGSNRVAVVAYDADGFASNPETLDVVSAARGERPDLWAVALGVSRYPKLAARHQLAFADDDARAIAKALAGLAGPDAPFAKAHVTTLTDAQVSVASTRKALADLSRMRPGDLAVVFLAGHGLRFADGQMRFLTHQASLKRAEAKAHGVGWKQLEKALAQAPGRVLVLLDACHSGHVTTEPVAPNEALAKALAARNRAGLLVFAASRGSQFSYEVGGEGSGSRGLELAWPGKPRGGEELQRGHGLFTAALLEALGGQVPDRDRSGAVELSELIDDVRERVRAASNGKQTPWVARRELFGDLTLMPAR
jgi:WD40 repeat protein/uncharacterized caspase-like protein